jgi:IMP dehydrogenase
MEVEKGYAYDDVLLIPKKSKISSRSTIDISTDLGRGVVLKIPIVSANMRDVTGMRMATTIAKLGGLAILHRFNDASYNQVQAFEDATHCGSEYVSNIGVSVGVKPEDESQAATLIGKGAKIICVDVAHGHHENVCKMIQTIRRIREDVLIIAGNVATHLGAIFLGQECGADVVKVGVGPGSLCTTRIETGNGVPQLTALEHAWNHRIERHWDYDKGCVVGTTEHYRTVADGGIKSAGDIVKALCFSNAVMIGNLLAGSSEAPGDIIVKDGQRYMRYAGSSTHKASHVEGVSGLVRYKGRTEQLVQKLVEGLRSGMSYQGASSLDELREDPKFVSISHAGLTESRPHDVMVIGE